VPQEMPLSRARGGLGCSLASTTKGRDGGTTPASSNLELKLASNLRQKVTFVLDTCRFAWTRFLEPPPLVAFPLSPAAFHARPRAGPLTLFNSKILYKKKTGRLFLFLYRDLNKNI